MAYIAKGHRRRVYGAGGPGGGGGLGGGGGGGGGNPTPGWVLYSTVITVASGDLAGATLTSNQL